MKITQSTLAELIAYIQDFKKILLHAPLNKKLYKEGTLLNQVAFHASQSIIYYMRTFVLNDNYKRNREHEYKSPHSLKEILASFDQALQTCDEVINNNLDLGTPLKQTRIIYSRGTELTTINEIIQHVTAHTAEHFGEINNALTQ